MFLVNTCSAPTDCLSMLFIAPAAGSDQAAYVRNAVLCVISAYQESLRQVCSRDVSPQHC